MAIPDGLAGALVGAGAGGALAAFSTSVSALAAEASNFFSAWAVNDSILPVSVFPSRWKGEMMASQTLMGFSMICTDRASHSEPSMSVNTPRLPTHRLPLPPAVTGTARSYCRLPSRPRTSTYSTKMLDVLATAAWILRLTTFTHSSNRRPSITSEPISNSARRSGSYRCGKLTKLLTNSSTRCW